MTVFLLTSRNDVLAFEYETDLDGPDFRFEFNYNRCDESWYMNMLDAEGCHLRDSIRGVVNTDVTAEWCDSKRPKGQIVFADVERLRQVAGERDLGDKVFPVYIGDS